MAGAKVGVFEKADHVGFSGLLDGEDGGRLESKVSLEVVGDFSNESLERKLSDEEFSGFLESSDLSEGDSSWSESVGSLDTTGGWGLTFGLFVSDVLSWLFSAGHFSSGVLGSSHFVLFNLNYIL